MGNCQTQSENLSINATTWTKDTHRLFDYESLDVTTQNFNIRETVYFRRDHTQLNTVSTTTSQIQNALLYVELNGTKQIKVGNLKCKLGDTVPQESNLQVQKVWISTRSVTKSLLQKGDIFRLGRVTFRLWDIDFKVPSEYSSCSSTEDADVCRICLRSGMPKNPLLNPCRCMGSLKYLHLECLKRWLREKQPSKQTENCSLYLWKDLECEICKFQYKPIFDSDNTTYHMNELVKPQSGYLILEFQCKKGEKNKQSQGDHFTSKSEGVYVVKLQNEIGIGRAKENLMRVGDISISRFHSTLRVEDGKLYLYDNNSKYGSLVLIQEDMKIGAEHNNVELQVGRTIFKLQLGIWMC